MESLEYFPEWGKNAIFYHIYPYGYFDTPYKNTKEAPIDRLDELRNFYDYFVDLGINVIQFGPIFESVSHGYDTIDYMKIDRRLGTNELFIDIVKELHERNIKVIVDGVFNHVGREFFAFQNICKNREESKYLDWFFIDFSKNNPLNDGFDYQNWEGYYDLVKLNLYNPEVINYLFTTITYWLRDVKIDGWRLDVAYLLSNEFLNSLRTHCKSINPECLILGELIHGPYSKWIGPNLMDGGTGYQIYKSIWSSLKDNNFYELKSVLESAFHPTHGLDKNIALMNFLGNHDTTRIRSILDNDNLLSSAYLTLFTLNGFPKIYYGDELGFTGKITEHSDRDVRKKFIQNPLSTDQKSWLDVVKRLIQLRKDNHALTHGNMLSFYANNTDCNILAFLRRSSKQTLLVIINGGPDEFNFEIPLWNLNISDGTKFRDILNAKEDYTVIHTKIHLGKLHSYWGMILEQL